MKMNKLWYLKKCDIFQGLNEEAMNKVQEVTQEKNIPKKQIIYDPGQKNELMFILKKGRVRIFKLSADGKMITIAILREGDIFGAMSMITGGTEGAYAETLEDSYVCSIRRKDFSQVVKKMPEVAIRMIEKINQKLKDAEDRIEDLTLRDVPGRIASVLLKLSEQFGRPQARGVMINFKITHQELADMVGSTRETVTLILGDFKREDIIRINEKQITIIDMQILKEWAGKD